MGLNLLAGILVFALGLIVTIGSGYLGKGLSYNEPGPGFFPRLIGIGLMICGLIESFLIFRRSEKIVAGWGDGSVRGWILWTLLGGYVFFLGRLHYLILTAAFLVSLSWFLGAKKVAANFFISIGLAAGVFALFNIWLKIPLP